MAETAPDPRPGLPSHARQRGNTWRRRVRGPRHRSGDCGIDPAAVPQPLPAAGRPGLYPRLSGEPCSRLLTGRQAAGVVGVPGVGGADDQFAEFTQEQGALDGSLDEYAAAVGLVGLAPRQADLAQPVDGAGDSRLRYLQGLDQPAHHVWRRRQVDAQQQRHLPGRQVWRFQPDAGDEGTAPDIECLQVGELRVHFRSLVGQFPVSGFRRIVSIAEFLTNPNRRREKFLVNHFRLVDPQQLGRGLAFGDLFQGI